MAQASTLSAAGENVDRKFPASSAMKETVSDVSRSGAVPSLLSYATSDDLSHELIPANAEHSAKAVYRLGYRWLITDFECLIKVIESLDSLNFFDRDEA